MKVAICIFSIVALLLAQMPQLPVYNGAAGSATVTGTSVLKGSSGNAVAAAASDVVALFNSGTCSGVLQSDGTCAALPTVTGSSVLKGSGGSAIAAAYTDVVTLWASGSCTGTLRSDGTCIDPNLQTGTTDLLCALTSDSGCSSHGATAETAFSTVYTIPSGTLITGKVYRVNIGFMNTSTAVVPTTLVKVKLGAATIYSSTTAALTAGTTAYAISGLIMGSAAAGAAAAVYSNLINTSSATNLKNSTAQPVNCATNGDLVLTVTAIFGAATTGNTMTLQTLAVEPLN